MTKIAIQPNASGTGTFTITAPNSNTNRTLTLPDAAGEVFTNTSILAVEQLPSQFGVSASAAAGALAVNTSGHITTPNQPGIYLDGNNGNNATFSGGQTVLISTHYSQINIRGGMAWNSSLGRVTVPTSGRYLLNYAVYNSGTSGRLQIRRNGGSQQLLQMNGVSNTKNNSFVLFLSANDYIDIVGDAFAVPTLFMGTTHTFFTLDLLG